MGIVDFSNPDACKWFGDKLRVLCDSGVDSFKTDFGERIPAEDVAWFDGSDPQRMHNYYSFIYNKVVFDVLKEKRGDKEAAVFARSATAGGQQFPVHWGGDSYSSFESMAESLRGGLSLSLSGFGFWSMISEALRACLLSKSTSAGSPSDCCHHIAACMAAPPTECHGCSTRKPLMSFASLPS
jgi:alpha-glucosidase (family GH31 glycosyl hydrolase)